MNFNVEGFPQTRLGKVHSDAQGCQVDSALVEPDTNHEQYADDDDDTHNEQPCQVGARSAVDIEAVELLHREGKRFREGRDAVGFRARPRSPE